MSLQSLVRGLPLTFILKAFLLGQLLAICNTGTGITSQYLTDKIKVTLPTTQSFLAYFFLCSSYGVCHLWTNGFTVIYSRVGLWCLFLAVTDFAATYITVKAYQYTSLVSVQLLDCVTIPTVMIITVILFRYKYRTLHYLGVMLCLAGVALLMFSDSHKGDSWKGNLLVIGGAILYGVNNACLEWLAKFIGPHTYLGTYCWFGLCISGVQMIILEVNDLEKAPWDDYRLYLCLMGFVICLVTFLSVMPIVMVRYSATFANLNLMAADIYSAFAGYAIFAVKFNFLYFVSMFLILGGVLSYIYQNYLNDINEVAPADEEESSQLVINQGQPEAGMILEK